MKKPIMLPLTRTSSLLGTAAVMLWGVLGWPGCLPTTNKPAPRPALLAELLLDTSSSSGDFGHRCEELEARAAEMLKLSPIIDLSVYTLGDSTSGHLPFLIAHARFEPSEEIFEDEHHELTRERSWISSLVRKCRSNLRQRDGSGLFISLQAISQDLQARSAELRRRNESPTAKIFVHSDMIEGISEQINTRMSEIDRSFHQGKRLGKPSRTLPRLELPPGVELVGCGIASRVTRPGQASFSVAALQATWSEVLGVPLVFSAYCPRRAQVDAVQGERGGQ